MRTPCMNSSTSLKDNMTPFVACLQAAPSPSSDYSAIHAVVVGGGTGAPLSIRVLLSLGLTVDAVVAMADDGASTGRLRKEAHILAPGDIRKCLLAFAKEPESPFAEAFGYRIASAADHSLGNLIIGSLEQACGNLPDAIALCEQMLQARGHVYPSTLTPVTLWAENKYGTHVESQAKASCSKASLSRIWLMSDDEQEEIQAYQPALDILQSADLIVLGPGSLFTSIIANLAVPGIVEAINSSRGRVVYVGSLTVAQKESTHFSIIDEIKKLEEAGLRHLDYVLVHKSQEANHACSADYLSLADAERSVLQRSSCKLIENDFSSGTSCSLHNPLALRSSFEEVLQACHFPTR